MWLLGQLGENSIRRHCGRAKQFFRAALRKRLIAENPFADMRDTSVRANRERDYFITQVDAQKVLDACPDSQWRLLFALSRYGGLRCPSEHLELMWQDIDWERDRFTVRSPKTEHHEGKESRTVPIFPELRPHLEAAFNEAQSQLGRPPSGTDHVITRYRDSNANLRTQMNRIIRRAGLEPWPKLFQNLRASRETELAEDYPMHVVCAWLGNSERIAARHYLQVTDEHFQRATEGGARKRTPATEVAAQKEAHFAAQETAQPTSANIRPHKVENENPNGEGDLCPMPANDGKYSHFGVVAGAGIEPARP